MIGKSIFYFPNNTKDEGDILDGKLHGIGLIYDSKGKKVFYGEFKNGKRVYIIIKSKNNLLIFI